MYVTCPDEPTAKRLARDVVERGLAACANVFPVQSVYRWEGRLVEEGEVAMLLKTRADRVEALTRALVEAHPYDVPCVVALPWSGAAPAYAQWVDASTRSG